jgi:hypothetical protein
MKSAQDRTALLRWRIHGTKEAYRVFESSHARQNTLPATPSRRKRFPNRNYRTTGKAAGDLPKRLWLTWHFTDENRDILGGGELIRWEAFRQVAVRCPGCEDWAMHLWLPPNGGQWLCRECHDLVSSRLPEDKLRDKLVNALESGDRYQVWAELGSTSSTHRQVVAEAQAEVARRRAEANLEKWRARVRRRIDRHGKVTEAEVQRLKAVGPGKARWMEHDRLPPQKPASFLGDLETLEPLDPSTQPTGEAEE